MHEGTFHLIEVAPVDLPSKRLVQERRRTICSGCGAHQQSSWDCDPASGEPPNGRQCISVLLKPIEAALQYLKRSCAPRPVY